MTVFGLRMHQKHFSLDCHGPSWTALLTRWRSPTGDWDVSLIPLSVGIDSLLVEQTRNWNKNNFGANVTDRRRMTA